MKDLRKVISQISGESIDKTDVSDSPSFGIIMERLQKDYSRKVESYYSKFIPISYQLFKEKISPKIQGPHKLIGDLLAVYQEINGDPGLESHLKDVLKLEIARTFLWLGDIIPDTTAKEGLCDYFSHRFCMISLQSNVTLIYEGKLTKTELLKPFKKHYTFLKLEDGELKIRSEFKEEKVLELLKEYQNS